MKTNKLFLILILAAFLISQTAFVPVDLQGPQMAMDEETTDPEDDDRVDRTIGSLFAFLVFGGLAGVFYLLRWYGQKTGKIEILDDPKKKKKGKAGK